MKTTKLSDGEKAALIAERLGELRRERSAYERTWEEIAEYVCPRNTECATGSVRTGGLSDVTAIHANEVLGAGQLAYVCPANEFWFKLESRDEDAPDEVVRWLERATRVLFNELASSNFYLEIHEHFLDRGSMGTACIYLQEGRHGALNFRNIPSGTFYIEEDCDGMVDSVFREFRWTARQAAQRFGAKALHPEMLKSLENRREWELVHAVYPREDAKPFNLLSVHKPYGSLWIDVANRHVLRESGYDEMPYFVSRFLKARGDKYGYSPAWSALPLIKQLNKIEDDLDALGEKAAFPAILAPFDGAYEIDLRPGGITYYDATKPDSMPREWQTSGRYDVGKDRAAEKRARIETMFYNDLFNMINRLDKTMTAREVAERSAEKLVQFSPTFARMITELLTPLLKRAFFLCGRKGLFGEVPQALNARGRNPALDIKIDYVSKIALAIKSLETRAFLQWMEMATPMAQVAPQVFDNVDFDAAARGLARNLNVPGNWLRPRETVEAERAGRAQVQAQAQQTQALMQSAEAVGKLPESLAVEAVRTLEASAAPAKPQTKEGQKRNTRFFSAENQ